MTDSRVKFSLSYCSARLSVCSLVAGNGDEEREFPKGNNKEIWKEENRGSVSCLRNTKETSFIKTTYDISLDSQISLLPLGFSLLGSNSMSDTALKRQ
jgi:hypothetical protein